MTKFNQFSSFSWSLVHSNTLTDKYKNQRDIYFYKKCLKFFVGLVEVILITSTYNKCPKKVNSIEFNVIIWSHPYSTPWPYYPIPSIFPSLKPQLYTFPKIYTPTYTLSEFDLSPTYLYCIKYRVEIPFFVFE